MADYLDSARLALEDALVHKPWEPDGDWLLRVADCHARIAICETLRAILGTIVGLPIEESA